MSLYFGSGDLYACGQLVSRFYRIRNSCYLYRIADAVNVLTFPTSCSYISLLGFAPAAITTVSAGRV